MQLCDARDSSGLSADSRDRIRMDVTVRSELDKLEEVRRSGVGRFFIAPTLQALEPLRVL